MTSRGSRVDPRRPNGHELYGDARRCFARMPQWATSANLCNVPVRAAALPPPLLDAAALGAQCWALNPLPELPLTSGGQAGRGFQQGPKPLMDT